MKLTFGGQKRAATWFRIKLFAAMMLIVGALTALGLFWGQRSIASNVDRDLQQNFQSELSSLHKLQELRDAALVERCRSLGQKPRIHAALEDNALDLLYLSAKDELRDLMQKDTPAVEQPATSLHAIFYRFLDSSGSLLRPPNAQEVGVLTPEEEGQLSVKGLSDKQEIGYLAQDADTRPRVIEVVAVPIFSTETGEVISALVVGFKPFEPPSKKSETGIKNGIWAAGLLDLQPFSRSARVSLANQIRNSIARNSARNNFVVQIEGTPHLLFYKRFNPDSIFPPAYEICVYPLARSIAELHRLRWKVGGAGVLLLLGGFVFSRYAAARLSKPVERMALDSEQNRAERKRAEAALESTTEELARTARYSADASHQLKSPVTVLRAGIEALLSREDFEPEVYEELSTLLHQTHRLTGVINDLLLLARMDAGHLRIKKEPVNLTELVEEWLDDLSALPDAPEVQVEKDVPRELYVSGERQYTSLIVQNLLENSRKYNRSGGRLRVIALKENNCVTLRIGNSGRTIPNAEQEHIFERFHRDGTGSAVAGHGLGLNLAQSLARLHGGELRLTQSKDDWTEFEVRFLAAQISSN